MKKMSVGVALLALPALFCLAHSAMPGPDAESLWKYIAEQSPYSRWSQWQERDPGRQGSAPHRPRYRVFVNDTGLAMSAPPASSGTIIVKENLGRDNSVQTVSVMYKIEGYNPDGGDWFWARYSRDGKVDQAGRRKGCIACHSTARLNDYLFTRSFAGK